MSNMSYCRFRNTLTDLYDCYEHWDENDDGELSLKKEEVAARRRLLKLCQQIVSDYAEEER